MPKFARYDKDGPFAYACGTFPAIELVKWRPEAVKAVLLMPNAGQSRGVDALLALLPPGTYVEEAPRAIERISGKENCHAVAVFDKYQDELSKDQPHVVLHQVSDMGNFGTIVRTCLGFGFDQIALIRPCVDPFDPRSVRASMGALFGVRLALFDTFEAYRALYGAHTPYFFRLNNAGDLYETRAEGLPALVFGNEGAGLPEALCRLPVGVKIPHGDGIDSLNLSVAVGIGASYFARQRSLVSGSNPSHILEK